MRACSLLGSLARFPGILDPDEQGLGLLDDQGLGLGALLGPRLLQLLLDLLNLVVALLIKTNPIDFQAA